MSKKYFMILIVLLVSTGIVFAETNNNTVSPAATAVSEDDNEEVLPKKDYNDAYVSIVIILFGQDLFVIIFTNGSCCRTNSIVICFCKNNTIVGSR